MGIRYLCGQLPNFYSDGNSRISRKLWAISVVNCHGDRGGLNQPSLVHLSPLCFIFLLYPGETYLSTRFILGRVTGAVALALALNLPLEIPHRSEIIPVTFEVVAFSVFVQSLTMQPILKAMSEIPSLGENFHANIIVSEEEMALLD